MIRFWNFLVSRTTGIVLLIAVSSILVIGAALPNPALLPASYAAQLQKESPRLFWLGERYNSMKIGTSPVFGLLGVFLVISTAACSIDRMVKQVRARRDTAKEPVPEGQRLEVSLRGMPDVEQVFLERLRHDRWNTKVYESPGRNIIAARKGTAGFWGSIFFHAILITLIAGIVVFFYSGFYGTLLITEGQELLLTPKNLQSIEKTPLYGFTLPALRLRFNSFSTVYHNDRTETDYGADFTIFDTRNGSSHEQTIKINSPFIRDGMEFLLVERGYAPAFVITKDGKPVYEAYVALRLNSDGMDSFRVPSEDLQINAQFFPDLVREDDGGVRTRSQIPRNPHFGIDVSRGGLGVLRGLLKKGESVKFGDYRFEFRDLRMWVTLHLVRETGLGFFFASAMVGLIGVLIRVLDPERQIIVVFAGQGNDRDILLYYSQKHYAGFLAEYAASLVQTIQHGRRGEEHVAH